jgi:hypothetical protein
MKLNLQRDCRLKAHKKLNFAFWLIFFGIEINILSSVATINCWISE